MISKSIIGAGSYGIGSGAGTVVVWFCGAWKVRRDKEGHEVCGAQWHHQDHKELHIGNTSMPCVHRTKKEAILCVSKRGR